MLNKILLIGNLGKDPELNVTPDGSLSQSSALRSTGAIKAQMASKRRKPSGSIL
jgi:single-stranded DNA-binding protein